MGLWGICLIPAPWLFGSAEILQFSLAQDTELYSVLFSILDHHFLQWCWNRGGQGGHCPPPIFGGSVNPFGIGEGRLSPPITTGPLNFFHLPASLISSLTVFKVTSSNTSLLEPHAGFFRLLMKGIFDRYVL